MIACFDNARKTPSVSLVINDMEILNMTTPETLLALQPPPILRANPRTDLLELARKIYEEQIRFLNWAYDNNLKAIYPDIREHIDRLHELGEMQCQVHIDLWREEQWSHYFFYFLATGKHLEEVIRQKKLYPRSAEIIDFAKERNRLKK
jgi:hypothetical protein